MESPFYDQLANTLNSSDEVPDEYLMPSNKSASLPRPNTTDFHWCTDTLFFLFYLAPRYSLQLHAAAKLFEKGWRYNMVIRNVYRVTIPLVKNLQLTSRQKFRFGLACPGLARPKRNFCLEVNWRFCTSGMVTL